MLHLGSGKASNPSGLKGVRGPFAVGIWNPTRITSDSAQERLRPGRCMHLSETEGDQVNIVNNNEMLFSRLRVAHLRVSTRLINWRPDLKVWRHWVSSGISWARLVSGGLSRSKVIQVAYFAKWVGTIVSTQGVNGLVKHLKTAHIMLMQGVPGSKLRVTSRDIGKTAVAAGGGGLPRVIPAYARNYIRRGDVSTLRFWLTMLGMYRIVVCKGQLKLGTITNPGVPLSRAFKVDWIFFVRRVFLRQLEGHVGRRLRGLTASEVLEAPSPEVISSASSDKTPDVGGNSFIHRFNSAQRWTEGEWGWSLFRYLSLHKRGTGTTQSLWTKMEAVAEARKMRQSFGGLVVNWSNVQVPNPFAGVSSSMKEFFGALEGVGNQSIKTDLNNLAARSGTKLNGRLSMKVEAAGKIRVFALVDYWTQVSLRPLHRWIFSLLKEIPQDGTFDQLKPIKRLLKRMPKGATVYSFDLSAATDRIPVLLQGFLLAVVFGRQFASCWRALLCGRTYFVGTRLAKRAGLASPHLTYAVGQPMGALSSWGMLALVHHAMVQYSAWKAGYKTWFDLYAILGDDVVIACDRVASQYRKLCEVIGVEIGIAKSLIAEGGTLEFAKRFFFRGEDVSGLPIKFWAAAQNTMGVTHALSAWYPTGTLANFLRAMGIGFKGASMGTSRWNAIPRRLRALLVLLTQPLVGGKFAFREFSDWLMSTSPADRSVNYDLLTRFTPWATGLMEEVLKPAGSILDTLEEEIFFPSGVVQDPGWAVVNSRVNEKVVLVRESLAKAEKSMQHLQSLDVKFNPIQCSAIFNQVVRVAERVNDIGLTAGKAENQKEDPKVRTVNIVQIFGLWNRLRNRILKHADAPLSNK